MNDKVNFITLSRHLRQNEDAAVYIL